MKSSSAYRAMARETLTGHWNEFALLFLLISAIAMIANAPAATTSLMGTLAAMGSMDAIDNLIWMNGAGGGASFLVAILVVLPLEYALYNLCLSYVRREEIAGGNIRELFREFSSNWSTYVLSGLLIALVIFLVMFPTLFIGAVIFALAYGLVPFVIRDNPGIGVREALRESRLMMRGHKAQLFCLELSFIGWVLLSCLCPIGFLWLAPYMYMATAHFYEDVKAEFYIPAP